MIHIAGVADMKISNQKSDLIKTHALGSCLGISIYDPVACVGGLLHVMLPLSTIDPVKAKENPYMFVDTGVPKLFIESYKAGAKKQRIVVKVAGGACTKNTEGEDYFKIGKRNFIMLKKLLWKNGVLLNSCDVGGFHYRTMSLHLENGDVMIDSNGEKRKL